MRSATPGSTGRHEQVWRPVPTCAIIRAVRPTPPASPGLPIGDADPASCLRSVSGGVRIALKVQPKASADRVEGVERGALRVRVTAAPDKGKANARVVKVLAAALGVPAGRLRIVSGEKSRDKVVEVDGLTPEETTRRLAGKE